MRRREARNNDETSVQLRLLRALRGRDMLSEAFREEATKIVLLVEMGFSSMADFRRQASLPVPEKRVRILVSEETSSADNGRRLRRSALRT